jgi:hypothetical protein
VGPVVVLTARLIGRPCGLSRRQGRVHRGSQAIGTARQSRDGGDKGDGHCWRGIVFVVGRTDVAHVDGGMG